MWWDSLERHAAALGGAGQGVAVAARLQTVWWWQSEQNAVLWLVAEVVEGHQAVTLTPSGVDPQPCPAGRAAAAAPSRAS